MFFHIAAKFIFIYAERLSFLGIFVSQNFVLQNPYWGFAPGPRWGTSVPKT